MARVDYDAWQGFVRMELVLDGFDRRAAEIVACHTALEREVAVILERTLLRSGYVSEFRYKEKVSLLAATWRGHDEDAAKVEAVLSRYGTLRNRVAHGDEEKIANAWRQLLIAYRALQPDADPDADLTPLSIAQGILSFFGDGPTPEDIRRMQERVEQMEARLDEGGAAAPDGAGD